MVLIVVVACFVVCVCHDAICLVYFMWLVVLFLLVRPSSVLGVRMLTVLLYFPPVTCVNSTSLRSRTFERDGRCS